LFIQLFFTPACRDYVCKRTDRGATQRYRLYPTRFTGQRYTDPDDVFATDNSLDDNLTTLQIGMRFYF
jgi:hypothetical protein